MCKNKQSKTSLKQICAACGEEIVGLRDRYDNLCDKCADKQDKIMEVRRRVAVLKNGWNFRIKNGEKVVRCPYCGSNAELSGSTVKIVSCRFCGCLATNYIAENPIKIYIRKGGDLIPFDYQHDVTHGTVFEFFEKMDASNEQSNILDNKEKLKKLNL